MPFFKKAAPEIKEVPIIKVTDPDNESSDEHDFMPVPLDTPPLKRLSIFKEAPKNESITEESVKSGCFCH